MTGLEQKIYQALKTCRDPELGIDVVSLGLIYGLEITPQKIIVIMTLTTPGCPLVPYFRHQLMAAVQRASGIEHVDIMLTFDPPWHPERMSTAARQQLSMLRS
ncbi:MAG: metal-sulfur cluster assembly factor [Candidatus Kerfeldbacteria bacterium]|nr:metal-sulfur cluster assembly factor [Candidatus Kerfeldbacteria bacterium]